MNWQGKLPKSEAPFRSKTLFEETSGVERAASGNIGASSRTRRHDLLRQVRGEALETIGRRRHQAILRHWREAVPDDRLAHLVKDATRALVRALQMRLAEHGVSFGHWTFLRILWETDGLTQRKLSEEAGVMEPTTFSALKAMEKLGYVTRRQMPGNRKNVYVFLTREGQRAERRKLVPLAEEVNNVAIRGVKPSDVATTRRALLAIIENLARDELESASERRRVPSTRELARRGRGRAQDEAAWPETAERPSHGITRKTRTGAALNQPLLVSAALENSLTSV